MIANNKSEIFTSQLINKYKENRHLGGRLVIGGRDYINQASFFADFLAKCWFVRAPRSNTRKDKDLL